MNSEEIIGIITFGKRDRFQVFSIGGLFKSIGIEASYEIIKPLGLTFSFGADGETIYSVAKIRKYERDFVFIISYRYAKDFRNRNSYYACAVAFERKYIPNINKLENIFKTLQTKYELDVNLSEPNKYTINFDIEETIKNINLSNVSFEYNKILNYVFEDNELFVNLNNEEEFFNLFRYFLIDHKKNSLTKYSQIYASTNGFDSLQYKDNSNYLNVSYVFDALKNDKKEIQKHRIKSEPNYIKQEKEERARRKEEEIRKKLEEEERIKKLEEEKNKKDNDGKKNKKGRGCLIFIAIAIIVILLVSNWGRISNMINSSKDTDTTEVEVDLDNADPETIRLNGLVENYKKTEHKSFEELNPAYNNLITPIWAHYSKHTNSKEIQAILNNFNIITKSKITIIIDEYISSPENYTQDSYEAMLLYLERYNGYARQKRIKTTDLIEKLEAFKKEVEAEKIKEEIDEILFNSNDFVRNEPYNPITKINYVKTLDRYKNNGYRKTEIEEMLKNLDDFELEEITYKDAEEQYNSGADNEEKNKKIKNLKKSIKISNYYKTEIQKLIDKL